MPVYDGWVDGPRPGWCERTCVVCPAQQLGPGGFDVVDQPGRRYGYDRAVGWRVDQETGTAVCVHPFRVGVPAGRYASAGVVMPDDGAAMPAVAAAALELPAEVTDLEGWLVATLRVADPRRLFTVVREAETVALQRFAPDAVTEALRRVLSVELVDR